LANLPILNEVIPVTQDEEIVNLWGSLENLYDPTTADYKLIAHYLKYGRRAYLDPLFDHINVTGLISNHPKSAEFHDRSDIFSYRILQNIQLFGPNDERSDLALVSLGGVPLTEKTRCIVLYATFNSDNLQKDASYTNKLLQLIRELEEAGYRGHVLYRIGGYPLLNRGGIRFVHVPYSFKVLALLEAFYLGYNQALWIDCSLHPTNDLSYVFQQIAAKGVYLLENGSRLDRDYHLGILPDAAIASCGLALNDLVSIPHTIAGVVGVSFQSLTGCNFIREWYRLTSLVDPAMTLYPEEFLVSVSCWRAYCQTAGHIRDSLDGRSEVKEKPKKSHKPFWFDKG
jgi:hypothetical protein